VGKATNKGENAVLLMELHSFATTCKSLHSAKFCAFSSVQRGMAGHNLNRFECFISLVRFVGCIYSVARSMQLWHRQAYQMQPLSSG